MSMKRFITIVISFLSVTVQAQTMRELLPSMPDSICRLLTRNNILDFPDYLDTQMKAEVRNRLGGNSEMQTLTDDYSLIRVSESSTLQLKLLPLSKTKLILTVYTYFLNDSTADSQFKIYDTKWQPLPTDKYLNVKREPNTLVQATLYSSDTNIRLRTVSPFGITLIDDDSKGLIQPSVVTLQWNGKKFK